MHIIADIETDGFKPRRIHCISALIAETGEAFNFAAQPGYHSLEDGVALLRSADRVTGHNFLAFDLRHLNNLLDASLDRRKVLDTLIAGRLLWPDLREEDEREGRVPLKLTGSHGLEAWGYRLGIHKGDFRKQTDWQRWTPAMSDYCQQDALVTAALYLRIADRADAIGMPL